MTAEAVVAFERHVKKEEARLRAEAAEGSEPIPTTKPKSKRK
jgi:hypothetical protein